MIEVAIMSSGHKLLANRARLSVLSQKTSEPFQCRIVTNSDGINREKEILNSKADWIVFLDEDCYFPKDSLLQHFKSLSERFPHVSVWGGLYQSESKASYSIRAYNRLCNLWVLSGQSDKGPSNLLGGCLAVRTNSISSLQSNPIHWGGEDTYLLRHLQAQGLILKLTDELQVLHAPQSQTLAKWIRRAYAQGLNRKKHQLKTPKISVRAFRFAIPDIKFWPIWFLHFLVLALAPTIQKFVPPDKKQSSEYKLPKKTKSPFSPYKAESRT